MPEMLYIDNHSPDFEDFSVLITNSNNFTITLMESLLIDRNHPPLNKNMNLYLSKLFDNQGTKFHHMMSHEND